MVVKRKRIEEGIKMTLKEIEYIKKCVKQDYITYSNKCKIIEILEKEKENIEWLSLFMRKKN